MNVQGPVKKQQPDGMSHGGGGVCGLWVGGWVSLVLGNFAPSAPGGGGGGGQGLALIFIPAGGGTPPPWTPSPPPVDPLPPFPLSSSAPEKLGFGNIH